jgi:hypothetical protein
VSHRCLAVYDFYAWFLGVIVLLALRGGEKTALKPGRRREGKKPSWV